MLKIIRFIKNSFKELLYEVTWPRTNQLERSMFLFLAGFFVSVTMVALINIGWEKVTSLIYSQF